MIEQIKIYITMRKAIILILTGAVILSLTAFYNGFPLLTPDSGKYIDAGFNKVVPEGRTAIYGLFIAHASWGFSLWLVVFSQALLVSLLIFYCFRYFSNSLQYPVYYLTFIFFVSFFTSATVTISSIGVGVFAIISLLAVSLILFARLKERDRTIIFLIAIMGLAADMSHIIAAFLITVLFAVATLVNRFRGAPAQKTYWKRIAAGGLAVLVACIMVLSLQYAMGKSMTIDLPPVNAHAFSSGLEFRIESFYSINNNLTRHVALHKWFNWELRESALSRQYFHGLSFKTLNIIQFAVYLLFAVMMGCLLIRKRFILQWKPFGISAVCIAVFIMSGVLFSQEALSPAWQLMWLIYLPACIYGARHRVEPQTAGHSPIQSLHPSIV